MAMTIGTEYDHIDITNGVGTIRHPLKDASAREHVYNLVKVQDAQPESDDNVVWVKETPENEVEVPTYEEFNELKSALLLLDDIPDTVQTLTRGADGKVSRIVHTSTAAGGGAVRTDTFVFTDAAVTETRTLDSGETLTIVVNRTTKAVTITHTAA